MMMRLVTAIRHWRYISCAVCSSNLVLSMFEIYTGNTYQEYSNCQTFMRDDADAYE